MYEKEVILDRKKYNKDEFHQGWQLLLSKIVTLILKKYWLINIKNNNCWLYSFEIKQIFAWMISFVSRYSLYSLIFKHNWLCREKDRISTTRILCANKSAINVGCFKPTLSCRTAVRKRKEKLKYSYEVRCFHSILNL